MMNQLILSIFSVLTLAGCAPSGEEKASGDQKENGKVAQATPVEQTQPQVPSDYVNGITEKNSGDKVGPVHLYGSIRVPMPGKKIYLYETEGKNHFAADSVAINGTEFDFGTREMHRGFYMLGMGNDPNNMMAVIINPDEPEIDIDFTSNRLNMNPASSNSNENKGWFQYYRQEQVLDREIKGLRRQRSSSSFKDRIDQQIAEKEQELKQTQIDFIKRFPDTFLAKYLTWKNPPFPGEKGRYWEDIDFNDESITRTPAMADRIQDFMRKHSGGQESGFFNCIDLVKTKSEVNNVVLEHALYTMMDGFYQSSMEDISMYILDNYVLDGDCSADLSDVIKQRAQGIINLQIGNTPPDFTIESWDGKTVNLMKEVKSNEYTLVMFWASWCHKCEQEIPVLKNVYSTYKSRGFGVVGVSVDNQKPAFVKAVEENELEWPNVCQYMMWDSPVAKDYRVTATPALFLLNKEGQIVDKPKRIFQVEQFLSKNM